MTPPTVTPTVPIRTPTRAQRTVNHAKRHAKKYGVGAAIAALIPILQVIGALGPVLCSMPFVHDKAQCLSSITAVKTASQELGTLDGMALDGAAVSDDPAPVTTEEVSP